MPASRDDHATVRHWPPELLIRPSKHPVVLVILSEQRTVHAQLLVYPVQDLHVILRQFYELSGPLALCFREDHVLSK